MDRRKLGAILDGTALFLLALQFMLRLFVNGERETGVQFLLAGLIWVGAACYFAGRALADDGVLRVSGIEVPLLVFAVLCLTSVRAATHFLPALMIAVTWISNALLFVVAFDWMAKRGVARAWTVLASSAFVVILYAVTQYAVFYPMLIDRVDAGQGLESIDAHMRPEVEARLRAGEPTGTFIVSNTLAGFLAVLLPMMIGSMLDSRRYGEGPNPKGAYWMSPDAVVRGMFLLGGFLALALTRSKGGWAAAAAGLAAFGALWMCRKRAVERRKIVATALILGIVAFVVLVPFGMIEKFRSIQSMQFRIDAYWKAATALVKESPWTGKGLGSFSEHYPRVKPDLQQETRHAHNDYLELAVEIGVIGAGAFVLIWAVTLARGVGPGGPVKVEAAPASKALLSIMAIAALGAMGGAYLLSGTFNDMDGKPYLIALMVVAWGAFAVSTHRANEARDGDGGAGLAVGAMAGIVAYLVHALVDFNWYAYGFAETLIVVAGIALAAGTRPMSVNLPGTVSWSFSALLLAFGGYILVGMAPGFLSGDTKQWAAKDAFEEARATPGTAERHVAYERAEALIDEAETFSKMDAEIPMLKAQIFFDHWSWASSIAVEGPPSESIEEKADIARMAAMRTIELRPDDPGAYYLDARMCFALGEYNFHLAVTGDAITDRWREGRCRSFFDLAHKQMTAAYHRYPTNPRYNFWYARTIDALGNNGPKAAHHYREALRLSGLVDNLPRMKLTDEEVTIIHARLSELDRR